jgi:hypothetical protein
MHHIPLRHIPLRQISLRHIPLRHIPLRHISLRHISLRHIPRRHIPLRQCATANGSPALPCLAAQCAALELWPVVSTRQPRWTPRRLKGTRGDARGTRGVLALLPPANSGRWPRRPEVRVRLCERGTAGVLTGHSQGTRAASTRQLCVYEWRGGADERVREPGTAGVLTGYSRGTQRVL